MKHFYHIYKSDFKYFIPYHMRKHLLKLNLLAIVLYLLTVNIANAQTGPGGVGTNDGTSELQVWLRPDGFQNSSGNPASNGETVETWINFSGYGNNATGSTPGSFEGAPLDSTISFFNGYPAVEFDGDFPGDDGFQLQDIIDNDSAATVILVLAGGDFVNNVGIFVGYPDGQVGSTSPSAKTIGIWVDDDRSLWGRFIEDGGPARSFSTANGIDIVSNDPLIIMNLADGVNTGFQYGNGSLANSTITYDGTLADYNDLLIGRQANEEFDGWITEVIVFNKALNDAERIIVDNYLAAKFGITDLTNDFFAFDATHGNEVAGIGQSGGDVDTAAFSSEILGIRTSGSNLDDGEFIFFGHDNGDTATWTTAEQPLSDSNFVRLEREWRFDTTGSPGSVTIAIDTADLPAKTSDFDYYYLWTDVDGDFTSGASPILLTRNDSVYEASNVTITDGMFATIALYRPIINFSDTLFNDFESITPASFIVEIPYPAYRDISVDGSFSGTSEDSPTMDSTFTIIATTTSDAVDVDINTSDTSDEDDETIIFDLDGASAVGAVVGGDSVSTYTVNDDDDASGITVQFDSPLNYGFKKTITISNSMVSGSTDLEDFPVLITVDGSDFTDIEGDVENANGFDIRFTYENSLTFLEHDIELYDVTNDVYVAWVKLPILNATEDTRLEMYYGNANVSTDPSVTSVWDDYVGVYQLGNNDFTDASANGHNGTNNGTVDDTGIAGRSQNFTDDDIILSSNFPNLGVGANTQFTISAWVYLPTISGIGTGRIFSDDANNSGGYAISLGDPGDGLIRSYTRNFSGAGIIDGTDVLAEDEWQQVVLVVDRDNEDRVIYINGASSNSDLSDVGTWGTDAGQAAIGGEGPGGENNNFDGRIDHVTIYDGVLSADWIATEFNMIDTVTSYISLGAEESMPGLNIAESTDTLALTVALSQTSGSDITVDYTVTGGSATEGSDYELTNGTLTIPSGSISNFFNVDITNDAVDEVDEDVTISLSNPSIGDLGTNNSITFTIADDDDEPTVVFVDSVVAVNEGSSEGEIFLSLSASSGTDVTVDYEITEITAEEGSDYIFPDGTATINAGNTSGSILFNIVDDDEIETKQTFSIKLSNPGNAVLDPQLDSAVVTINDNDNFGIDGPGGVGEADGTGSLVFWVIGDSATNTGDGTSVTGWINEVGISELDLTVPNSNPTFNLNVINGHSEVSFANVNDALESSSSLSASFFPFNEATTFVVSQSDNLSQVSSVLTIDDNDIGALPSNRFTIQLPNNSTNEFDIGTANLDFPFDASWDGLYNIFTFRASSTDGREGWRNNASQATAGGTSNFIDQTDYNLYLGHSTSDNFQGNILETIIYTTPLNNTQINIVNNYLGAKYDLTLDNDLYAFNTTHSNSVAGIGQEAFDDFHVSAQSEFVTISNASTLGDGDYVLFGNDNASIASWVATDIPSIDSLRRLDREWRFDITGSPGTVSISIDTTSLVNKPAGYNDYIILTDDDGDFSDATIHATSLVDGAFIANDVEVSLGTYMAVGILIRKIDFNSTSISASETSNNVLTIDLNQRTDEDITVSYVVKSATATQGADYLADSTGTITINAGSVTANLDLQIADESELEGDENIVIALRDAPAGTFLGADSVFTYTIVDDDNDREIDFRLPCEYGFSKTITIDNAQVSGTSDLTNFPLLVSITNDDSLRSVSNSGNVESEFGFDIGFTYKDSLTWLDHEIESYDPATGTYVAWVLLPVLDHNDDTEINIYYGNSNITSDPSNTNVWSEYLGVWHLNGDDFDSSPNSHNGTNNGTVTTTGKIADAKDFDGTDFIELATFPDLQVDFSISAWVNPINTAIGQRIFIDDDNNTGGYSLSVGDPGSGRTRFFSRDMTPVSIDAASTVPTGSWTYLAGVADISDDGRRIIYFNGSEDVNTEHDGTWGTDVGSAAIGGETLSGETANRFNGQLDEVRVYDGLLSADRVATEYNNYDDPSTFYSIGIQDTISGCFVAENVGDSLEITIAVLPTDNASATTVQYEATGGTATNTDDYELNTGTLTIPAGSQSATFKFPITNDLIDEQDETIEITISNPSTNAKIGSNNVLTYTITDDDDGPTVAFVDTVSTINEGSSTVGIPVSLSVESGNDVMVDYEVKSSTANAGSDFVALSGTLTIDAGDLTNTISFQPIDDEEIETEETIEIRLFNVQNATLEEDSIHVVTLKDNDDLGFEGPGGVGDVTNTDGEGFLKIWLIADSASASLTDWPNEIQNVDVDFTMIPDGGGNPNLIDNAINGHKTVSFEDAADALKSTDLLSAVSFPGNEFSIFIVTEADNLNQDSYAYATDDTETGAVDANNISAAIPNDSQQAEFEISGDNQTVAYDVAWTGDHSIFSHTVSSDTFLVTRNNTTEIMVDPTGQTFTNQTSFNFWLGKSGATDNFQGDIAEFILFSRALNLAQIKIINNYLAAKYNLSVSEDLYNFNVTHGNEVAGIGQVDTSNQHVAAKAGILTVSNASDLDDNEFVLFGNNNADASTWVSTESPATGVLRTTREWRIDKTGSPGSVTIAIDTTLLPDRPNGDEDYVIAVDADGDFSSGATIISTTFVDDQFKASNISFNSGDYITVGILTRTLAFDVANANGFESVANNAQINLSLQSTEDIEFTYSVTGGTASLGDDYSIDSTSNVTILAGQTDVNIPLGIINDAELESDETIEITLFDAPAGVVFGEDSVFTYTIRDDDNFRRIQFLVDSSSGDESVSNVDIIAVIDSVDNTNVTSATVSITGGDAEASPAPDYTFSDLLFEIQPNDSTDTVSVTIIDDVLFEDGETIIFSLSSPSNAGLGDTTDFVYTIEDNDTPVIASFQDTTITIDEGGSSASVVVELNTIAGKDVEVAYAVDGSSTADGGGIDYTLVDGSLTIASGDQFATINIALTDDDIEESSETIVIGIDGDEVVGNSADTAIITITDNDALSGFYGPGGVGNSETNLLWLDVFNINGRGVTGPTDGSTINTWVDNSGNGFDFTAKGSAPTLDSVGFNNRPTINITSGQGGFDGTMSGFSNALSNYTMIVVSNQTSGDSLAATNTSGNGRFALSNSTSGLYTFDGTTYLAGAGTIANNITTWQFNVQGDATAEVLRNGDSIASDNNFTVMSLASNFSIGNGFSSSAGSDFVGDISEFIIFNDPLSDVKRIIVENYLAAKYDQPITNDLYSFEGTFFYDVVGVGSLGTSGGQHLEAMSDSLLLISNPSDLDSGEFVFMGHDNGDKNNWTTFEAPQSGTNIRRIEREWRIDTVGNPGSVVFRVDIDKLPPPESGGFNQYAVYTDTDGNFSNGATISQLNFSPTSGLYVSDPLDVDEGTYITIGIIQPVIQFALSSSDSTEGFTNPKIDVELNFSRDENVTVLYQATGGTATGGNVDYLLADGTLTIAPGNLSDEIDLGIIDDATPESSETIEITLSNPSSNVSLGALDQHIYTINDNDNNQQVTLAFTDSTFAENGSDADSIAVQLFLLNQAGDDSVASDGSQYAIFSIEAASTAEFGVDYDTIGSFVGDTLFIPSGDSTATFQLAVDDDNLFESEETIIIRLSNSNVNVGANNEVTFTVTDDDTEPVAQFIDTVAFGQESVSPVLIDVELNEASGVDAEIFYTVSSTNATQGVDFDLTDGSIIIEAGETEASIALTVNDDALVETGESVTINLNAADSATLGSNVNFTYTILDDDDLGSTGPGGVGDFENNILWLRADNFNTIWADTSGNNVVSTNFGDPAQTAMNSNFNNQPTINFDGNDAIDIDAFSSASSDYDIYYVYEAPNTGAQNLFSSTSLSLYHEDATPRAYTDADSDEGSEIVSTNPNILNFRLISGNNTEILRDGTSIEGSLSYDQAAISGQVSIGSDATQSGSFLNNVDLAEVIFYNTVLNSAQRKIIENYLSSRYSIIVANDLFAEDSVGTLNIYTEDLAGIGRDSSTAIHTSATSANQLRISDANDLSTVGDDGEFLLFAHNGGVTDAWSSVSNGILRLNRTWKFNITGGDPGSVTVTIDTAAIDTIARTDFPTYALLVSANGDFVNNLDATYSLNSIGGNEFQATGVDISDTDIVAIGTIRNQSGASGDFSNTATWSTGIVPGSGDDVFITDGDNVTLDINAAIGSLTIEDNATFNLDGNTLTLDQGCITLEGINSVIDLTSGGEIEYGATGDQCVTGTTYADVSFSTSGTKTLDGDMIVTGDLSITDNIVTFDANNFDIDFAGDWSNDGSFTAGNGTVTANGSSNQSLQASAGGETFFKFIMNKTGALNLLSPLTVEDSLHLGSGIISLADNDLQLTNNSGDHLSGGSNSSYIRAISAGNIIVSIANGQQYSVPIGDADEYSPFAIEINALSGGNPTVSFGVRDAKYSEVRSEFVHITRYWIVEGFDISTIDFNIGFKYIEATDIAGGTSVEADLVPVKFDTEADTSDFSSFTLSVADDTLSWDNITSFSFFTGGVSENITPLPVELLYFNGLADEGRVLLQWATATEINNDFFEVQKSETGEDFEVIGTVDGSGDSDELLEYEFVDKQPFTGENFYRLRQVDFDGSYEYSNIIRVENELEDFKFLVSIFPNPVEEKEFMVDIKTPNFNAPIEIYLVDMFGKLVSSQTVILGQANDIVKFDLPESTDDGVYVVMVRQNKRAIFRKIIIK